MVNDTEPRYRLVDADGNVVGSLFAESDGTLKLQEGTSGNNNELALTTQGEVEVEQVTTTTLTSGFDFSQIDTGSTTTLSAFDGGSNDIYEQYGQFTADVSTSTKTIITRNLATDGGSVIVRGKDGTGNRFSDILNVSFFDGVQVVDSFDAAGTPASRSYSVSGGDLQLSMSADTYQVGALMDSIRPGL